ncbi:MULTISPECIES: hypothetical protein [unclassified Leuconostoc]|jgi:antitoxin component of MazEF toxin-antitoxin module|uniref:AbrB/MazE/SpoVT family DNA-binding domain-containing protein n=1 Tax=Leuconostoc TaxID=1243 RepID=UPI001903EA93|nr:MULTISPECIES: hypothetical protein [unclassified Leuconostoc]MBK0039776.1 hypothetical protein [Leuconostoc sp. S51]MBK0050735.1 hypothetical protein [Leuconostoc sp. S50]
MVVSTTSIKTWGNGSGIRLTKQMLAASGLSEHDEIQLTIQSGRIVVEPKQPQSLDDVFKDWHGYYAPTGEADDWDSMGSVGDEL